MPGETYLHGSRLRCYVIGVRKGLKGPSITLSRTHPNLVRKLFALEVPEIADGTVEIVALAREAGHRSKVAVRSTVPGVNAKGACIGPMGQRVRAVMAELHGEKIDIVDYSEDPAEFVASALSPARVASVQVVDPGAPAARVVVPDYQLSLAIGKEGQNARLAAKLTGWRIDIRSDTAARPQGGPADRPRPGEQRSTCAHRSAGSGAARRGLHCPRPVTRSAKPTPVDGLRQESLRTCVGCRARADRSVLLRVVAAEVDGDWSVVPDPRHRLPGPGCVAASRPRVPGARAAQAGVRPGTAPGRAARPGTAARAPRRDQAAGNRRTTEQHQ